MANLLGQDTDFNYKGILNLHTLDGGLTASMQAIEDGMGSPTAINVATGKTNITGLVGIDQADPGVFPEYAVNPISKFTVSNAPAVVNLQDWAQITADSQHYFSSSITSEVFGFYSRAYSQIDLGVTISGQSTAFYGESFRTAYTSGKIDSGTLESLYGARLLYGHVDDATSNPTTNNVYGLYLYPHSTNGTIVNMYDLYIARSFPTSTNDSFVTNHWALYQRAQIANNYFGGNVGIGIDTPTNFLQVAQQTTGPGTVSNGAAGTAVTGVRTQFLNTFKVGDTITIVGQTVAISAIADDTHMTTAAITNANSAVSYTLVGGTRFRVQGNGSVFANENGGYTQVGPFYFNFSSKNEISPQASGSFITLYGGGSSQGGRIDFMGGGNTAKDARGSLVFRTAAATGLPGPEYMRVDTSGNLGVNIAHPSNRFQVNSDAVAGTGTISSSGTAVTGVGTTFTTELKIGYAINTLQVIDNTVIRTRVVTAIADNTHCTVDTTWVNGTSNPDIVAGTTFTYSRPVFSVSSVSGNISGSGIAIAGSFSGVAAVTTVFTVTIGSAMLNATYKVNVTPTSALSAALFYVTNKTTTSFDVTYLAGLTGTVTFDWAVFP